MAKKTIKLSQLSKDFAMKSKDVLDAFKEMGGKLSFSLCLLDDENNGFILTSMHTREGCYTYVKEIIKGESFVVLAAEERRALEEAKNRRSLYAE